MSYSKTMDQAEKFYSENKEELLDIMLQEFRGEIDYQTEWNQVAVWFDGFSLCYQDSDMNGKGKGEAHFDNSGADSGLDDLAEILKQDPRFQPLVASEEYHSDEYLTEIVYDFCQKFAEIHKIAGLMETEDD